MKICETILSLHEKLIIINKGKKSGQVLFLAGGAGSGKGFAQDKFIDVNSYKVFDVDALKARIIKVAKLKGDKEIANLDLKNPDDVFKLHQLVKDKGLDDKQIDTLLKGTSKEKGLPNLLFDTTFKDTKKFNELTDKLTKFGYEPENMHVVWVLANYQIAAIQNQERPRVVPDDILFQTHKGAAQTMSSILKGQLPKNLKGEIYILLSEKGKTEIFLDKEGKVKTGTSGITKEQTITIKDFQYIKVKDAGKSLESDSEIKQRVFDWIKTRVPKSVRKAFK